MSIGRFVRAGLSVGAGALASWLVGCAPVDGSRGDATGTDGKADVVANGGEVPTRNGNVELLRGYHSLFDRAAGDCVEAGGGEAKLEVGESAAVFDLVYISSREDLARELGIDLGLRVRYAAVGGDVDVGLLRQYSESRNSVSFLLKVGHEYTVRAIDEVQATPEAKARFDEGLGPFVRLCGTNYVRGIRYGAHLYVLVTYETEDEATANQIRANIGVDGGAPLNASLKAKLSDTATSHGVRATVRASAYGVNLTGSVAAPEDDEGGENTLIRDIVESGRDPAKLPQMFVHVDRIHDMIRASIEADRCRDAGITSCAGEASSARVRHARTVSAELGSYYDASELADNGTSFQRLQRNLSSVTDYVRALTTLQSRMELALEREIEPFRDAPDERKARHNAARPRRTLDELVELAEEWSSAFVPQVRTGTEFARLPSVERAVAAAMESGAREPGDTLGHLIQQCWDEAAHDVEHTCGADRVRPADLPEHRAATDLLERYADDGRILPLRVRSSERPEWTEDAPYVCDEIADVDGTRYRLPTAAEVDSLAIYVAYGNDLPSAGPLPNTVFYRATNAEGCAMGVGLYTNEPGTADASRACAADDVRLPVVCVPRSGPTSRIARP